MCHCTCYYADTVFFRLLVMKAVENSFDFVDTREPKLYLDLKLIFGFFFLEKNVL